MAHDRPVAVAREPSSLVRVSCEVVPSHRTYVRTAVGRNEIAREPELPRSERLVEVVAAGRIMQHLALDIFAGGEAGALPAGVRPG